MLPAGSHVLSVNDVYGGTFRYFTKVASNNGIEVTFVDLFDPSILPSVVKANTKMIWIETPSMIQIKI